MVAITAENHVSGQFVNATNWTRRYQRNNKRSGLKNLRCFPYCSDSHRLRGFCGRSVLFKFKGNSNISKKIFSWAEFRKVVTLDDTRKAKEEEPGVQVGQILTAKEVEDRTRTKDDAFKPWYGGEPVGGNQARSNDTIVFEFNKNKKGWNYGWVANKHTCDSEHVLRSYIFEQLDESTFKCIFALDSPRFTLFCRRRQRQNLADLPVQLRKQLEMQQEIKEKKQIPKVSKSLLSGENKIHIKNERSILRKRKSKIGEPREFYKADDNTLFGFFTEKGEWNASPFFEESSMLLPVGKQACKKLKEELSPEKKDEIVCKIIQALLRVDIKEKNRNKPVETNEQKLDTDDVIDAGFAGFFDNLMPEGWQNDFFDSVFNDDSPSSPRSDGSSGSDTDFSCFEDFLQPLKVDVSILNSGDMKKKSLSKEGLLEALARYLVEEDGFMNAIEKAFSNGTLEGKTFDERKRMVIDVFAEQVEVFLKRSGATMKDLEKLVKSNKKPIKDKTILEQIQNFSPRVESDSPTKQVEKSWLKPSENLDLSGTWRRDVDTLQILEKVRSDIGVPWIVRKLYKKMEEDFIIDMTGNKMELQYVTKKKMMSNGCCTYILDGKERPFTLTSPLPLQKSDRASYCAYRVGNAVKIVHNYDKNNRMCRKITVTEDGSKLQSRTTYETREGGSKKWTERGRW
eukprot:CAMPEP_0204822768 /NCGR_PEP_ID=MMETSP1346-20131115/952_1 /ASSEMBLY_ACC=CAM_ASM_000771 /TAXON_ID=215587 /ORGANISM="Aplanochytrium stocchinoi, Strain GSBS06" /LENGTH=681 /DNA_ID=CAMNT_0051949153 /DNA_START=329 /DNA_END=2371 /DNA_ORIENTATION=-